MTNIRALVGKLVYGVPPSFHEAAAPPTSVVYVPEHMLPPDADASPWRVDASGVQWYAVTTSTGSVGGGRNHD